MSLATAIFRPKSESKVKLRQKQPPTSKAKGREKRRTAPRTEKAETKRDLTLPTPLPHGDPGVHETWRAISDVAAAPHGAGPHVSQADHAGTPSLVGPHGTGDLGTPPSGEGSPDMKTEKENPGAGPTARGASAEIPY